MVRWPVKFPNFFTENFFSEKFKNLNALFLAFGKYLQTKIQKFDNFGLAQLIFAENVISSR